MKHFKWFLLSLYFLLTTHYASADLYPTDPQLIATAHPAWEEVLEYARAHFSTQGQLLMKPGGFSYIKVDDDYIHVLFPMLGLAEDGFKEPPYFRSKQAPGAHISVFYEDENIVPEEIGEYFHFELKQILIVQPSRYTSYAVLQVSSPELEQLRVKYGLSPKLFGHEYHISIAKKMTPKH